MGSERVFVTGGSGFVGRRLIDRLRTDGFAVTAAVRDREAGSGWVDDVAGHDVVVHCAARVHVMDERAADSLAEFRRANVDSTLQLAREAVARGVRRFVFISSIKVNGEESPPGQPYTAFDIPAPQDPYGISKLEAEQGLRKLAQETGLQVVIIRPVLVYGPGVKANFRRMMSWLSKGVPLPLGAIHNRRSLVSLDNLVDLVVTCIDHPAAAGEVFLVSDGEDLSTTEMLRRLGCALDKPARLIPVPHFLLEAGAGLLGQRRVAQRLFGSLQVDIWHTCATLNWTPPVSVDDGFRAAASAFMTE